MSDKLNFNWTLEYEVDEKGRPLFFYFEAKQPDHEWEVWHTEDIVAVVIDPMEGEFIKYDVKAGTYLDMASVDINDLALFMPKLKADRDTIWFLCNEIDDGRIDVRGVTFASELLAKVDE